MEVIKINENTYNLRCPFCGDSKKDLKKRRGYIYKKYNKWHYYCHNCGIYKSYKDFVKETNFQNFLLSENLNIYKKIKKQIIKKEQINYVNVLQLPTNHHAIDYLRQRKIPENKWKDIFYTNNPYSLKDKFLYYPSIFFKCYYKNNLIGYVFRLIKNEKIRYFTYKSEFAKEKNLPFYYNYDNLNFQSKIYVTEGIIDSLFLPNSLAINGMNNISQLNWLKNLKHVIVLDNEFNSKHTRKTYERLIKLGYTVFIWPEIDVKDVNDYVIKYNDINSLLKLINENSFSGLKAKLILTTK